MVGRAEKERQGVESLNKHMNVLQTLMALVKNTSQLATAADLNAIDIDGTPDLLQLWENRPHCTKLLVL